MKKIVYSLSVILVLTGTGCTKMLDINSNPNLPVQEYMEPHHFLPRVLDVYGTRVSTTYGYAARWMGYWARSGNYGANIDEESYRIGSNFAVSTTQWSGWYGIMYDNYNMEQLGRSTKQPFYVAAACVMKSIGFMYLVDQFGNVPYTQAFRLTEFIQPVYDKGEDIYTDLLKQLDEAMAIFTAYDPNQNLHVRESDIMFGGDIDMWRKLANTQRLRLLIRMSQTGKDLSAEFDKIRNDDAGLIGSGETAYINPGYTRDNNKQSPFFASHSRGVDGNPSDDFNRANNYILGLYRNNDDIRYQYVFASAINPGAGGNYVGYDYGNNAAGQPQAVATSGVDGPSFAASDAQDQWFFTSVESLFLQAEAIQRGWLPGDAEQAYRAAVEESFIWLNVGGNRANAVAAAHAYLDAGNAIADWSQADTDQKKIELIVTQKYLAMIGLGNFEAWADYRRLGVPDVALSIYPGAETRIPARLRYPQSEYSFNGPNVAKEGDVDQFAPVFWDK